MKTRYCKLETSQGKFEEMTAKAGVPLSSFLFCLAIEPLIAKVKEKFGVICYMDDFFLALNSVDENSLNK